MKIKHIGICVVLVVCLFLAACGSSGERISGTWFYEGTNSTFVFSGNSFTRTIHVYRALPVASEGDEDFNPAQHLLEGEELIYADGVFSARAVVVDEGSYRISAVDDDRYEIRFTFESGGTTTVAFVRVDDNTVTIGTRDFVRQ